MFHDKASLLSPAPLSAETGESDVVNS